MEHPMNYSHYGRLLLMVVLSFLSMYALMYAMVNVIGNVFANVNQLYMAGLMAAPMAVIELVLMRGMYRNSRLNLAIGAAAVVAGAAFFFLIREQVAVSDREFVRSMIPHHASAILMCEKNELKDPELQRLCGTIVSSQREEIAQMKAILERLDK